jgi:C1A family cysteine protease
MSTGILTAADYAFFDFVSSFGKHYATKAEFQFRQALFKENYEFVEKWNSDLTHSHTLGINEFSDWTKDETKRLTGSRVGATRQREKATFNDTSSIPSTWSWADQGMVTEVKNQGKCGSCWAFAITASVESAMAISGKGKLQNFSEQQLLDCTADAGNSCKGGWIDPTFDYIEAHPQMTYAEYPYVGVQQSTCAYEQSQGVGKVGSFK